MHVDALHKWQLVYKCTRNNQEKTTSLLASLCTLGVRLLTGSAVAANFGSLFNIWQKWHISHHTEQECCFLIHNW